MFSYKIVPASYNHRAAKHSELHLTVCQRNHHTKFENEMTILTCQITSILKSCACYSNKTTCLMPNLASSRASSGSSCGNNQGDMFLN